MPAAKREKTKYPGVYFYMKKRLDGKGEERNYYVMYRRGGRAGRLIEEPVGKESEGMTAAKANVIRAARASGSEACNTEKRVEKKKEIYTIAKIWNIYAEANKAKPTVNRNDKYLFNLVSSVANMDVLKITTKDIDDLRIRLGTVKNSRAKDKDTEHLAPQTIRHALVFLRKIINFGEKRNLFILQTRLHFEMPKIDNIKTEVLTDEQQERYLNAISEEPDQTAAAFLRMAMLTGMRKGALCALKWDDLEFQRGIITLRGSSAKKGKTEHIPMSGAVKALLLGIMRTDSPYVFPGKDGKQRKEFQKVARRVKEKAGLPADFRPLHGLRHNFASRLASSGKVDMYTLQKLLTHESPQMTQRYAHLHDDTLRRAANLADTLLLPQKKDAEDGQS